jgi:hypothetical protein
MLETSKERVKLLKMGIDGKTIEKLYIKNNGFKIIDRLILLNFN